MTNPIRIVDADGRIHLARADPEHTLAQVLFMEGLWPTRPFCAGLGRCGHCLVYIQGVAPEPLPAEIAALSREVLARGGRLACRRRADSGLDIAVPFSFPDSESRVAPITLPRAIQGSLSLAVDLGTTSLHWQVRDQLGLLAGGQELNPQLAVGSEVMSRLAFALSDPDNATAMRDVVLRRLHVLASVFPELPDRMCVAGNTVMTALLLGWPLERLAAAPYGLPHPGGFWSELPFPDGKMIPTYIPPLPAPFIGADLSAGLAMLHFTRSETPEYPYLLADLGTNGEFILALSPRRYLAASVPMGPALEGIGMARGSAALPGVWVDVAFTAQGLRPRALPEPDFATATRVALSSAADQDKPALQATVQPLVQQSGQRISGTGYLSLLAGLRRLELLDEKGGFAAGLTPLARRLGLGLVRQDGEQRLQLGPDVYLTGRDVEEVLKVKAAFNLAFSRLLEEGGIAPSALRAVYLAGALGDHVDLTALEDLGFVPLGMRQRIQILGNASLAGAALLADDQNARTWTEEVVSKITTLGIGQEENFFSQFIQRLVFRHV